MPIIGGEQIQLEVPARLVVDVFPIEDHAEPEVLPLRDDQFGRVAGDAGGDRLPVATRRGDRLERQPTPVPDLDRVAALPRGEQAENPALEEGGVHPELQGDAPPEPAAQVRDELAQKGHGLLGVVDIARAVLQPEDMAGLGHMGDQRVVARVLPMMGVEPPERPADRGPRADDRPVHINGQAGQVKAGQRLGHEVAVEGDERGEGLLGELAQPVRHGATGRQARQAAEAGHQRIAAEVAEVLQPSGADIEQRQQHQGNPVTAVVAAQSRECLAQPRAQVDPVQIPPEQLQPAVRRERLRHELDREIPLDHPPQGRYLQAHQRGLQCGRECIGLLSLKSALEASLIHVSHTFTSRLFADWG